MIAPTSTRGGGDNATLTIPRVRTLSANHSMFGRDEGKIRQIRELKPGAFQILASAYLGLMDMHCPCQKGYG